MRTLYIEKIRLTLLNNPCVNEEINRKKSFWTEPYVKTCRIKLNQCLWNEMWKRPKFYRGVQRKTKRKGNVRAEISEIAYIHQIKVSQKLFLLQTNEIDQLVVLLFISKKEGTSNQSWKWKRFTTNAAPDHRRVKRCYFKQLFARMWKFNKNIQFPGVKTTT